MTTRVTVDAHAGWPVEVTVVDRLVLADGGEQTRETVETVAPNTTRDFYVHSHRELRVKEVPL